MLCPFPTHFRSCLDHCVMNTSSINSMNQTLIERLYLWEVLKCYYNVGWFLLDLDFVILIGEP